MEGHISRDATTCSSAYHHQSLTTMAPNLALSTHDLIQNIISSKFQGDKALKDDDIAKIADCSDRTVRHIRSNLLLFGSTRALSNGARRPKTITPPILTALHDQLALDPCMRLNDMAAFLRKEFNADVTRFSIRRALKDPEWSKKVTQNVARERNQDLRDEYVHEISFLRSDQLVFVDESGVDKSVGTRRKGWAPRGKRPRQVKRFHRGSRFQILPTYTQDGVIHFRVYEGSTDTTIFEDFTETLLPYYGRWPEPRSVLIMDNASFHHSERIQRMYDEAGVILRFLPPYSPDLNPIEEFFGELKAYIRQVWDEHEGFIRADFLSFLEECVTIVGGRVTSAKGHFRRAGISIDELTVKYNIRNARTCYDFYIASY
jgi:transposase